MRIILPIGISGSGKSLLYKSMFKDIDIVSPDLIRYELTGDISNQECNGHVFKIVDKRIDEHVLLNKDVYLDATNVNRKTRKKFVNKYKDNPNVEIIYYVLPANIKLSYERIQKDIENQVNRSKVPFSVLLRQLDMYNESIDMNFEGENYSQIIWIKQEDLDKLCTR